MTQLYAHQAAALNASTDALSQRLRRSSSDLLDMQAGFGAVITGSGIAGRGVADMTTKITALSVEFANFFRIQDTEAFDLMQGALLGQTRALQRYGIVLNDATMQEYLHKKGIKEKFNEMSQSQQVMQRYNFLMDNTKRIQEGGAKATDSLSSRMAELRGEWSDLLETAGKPALPVAVKVIDTLNEHIKETIASAIALQKALINAINVRIAADEGLTTRMVGDYAVQDYTHPDFLARKGSLAAGALDYTPLDLSPSSEPYLSFGGGGGGSDAGESAEKAKEKVKDSLEEIREEYNDTEDAINDALTDLEIEHEDKMDSIQDSIDKVAQSIEDLGIEYEKTLDKIEGRSMDSVVGQIEKVAELQDKLDAFRKAGNEGFMNDKLTTVLGNLLPGQEKLTHQNIQDFQLTPDQADAVNTALQLNRERGALDKYLQANPDVMQSDSFASAQARSKMTDFERDQAGFEQEEADATEKYNKQLEEYKKQQVELEKTKQSEEDLYATRKKALTDTLADLRKFADKWQENMQNIDNVTEEIVGNLKTRLKELQDVISSIDALMQRRADVTGGVDLTTQVRGRAAGGRTRVGEWTVVGEDGPELIRAPAGSTVLGNVESEGRMPSNSGSIVIQGPLISVGTVEKTADIDEVLDRAARKIDLLRQGSK